MIVRSSSLQEEQERRSERKETTSGQSVLLVVIEKMFHCMYICNCRRKLEGGDKSVKFVFFCRRGGGVRQVQFFCLFFLGG